MTSPHRDDPVIAAQRAQQATARASIEARALVGGWETWQAAELPIEEKSGFEL